MELLTTAIAFAIITVLILGFLRFITDLADGVDPLEEHRTPKFPCCKCEHYVKTERFDEKYTACCDGVDGEPRHCRNVRASKKCAKNARKVS